MCGFPAASHPKSGKSRVAGTLRISGVETAGLGGDHALEMIAVLVALALHAAFRGLVPLAETGLLLLGFLLPGLDGGELGHGNLLVGEAV